MPTYTYKCTACEDVIEKRQSFSDPPLTTCEQCGGALRKVIHPVGIVFKGSGWYITDSRSSSSSSVNGRQSDSSSEKGEKAEKASSGTSSESSGSKDAGTSSSKGASSTTNVTTSEKASQS